MKGGEVDACPPWPSVHSGCLYRHTSLGRELLELRQCQLVFPVASTVPELELVFHQYLLNGWMNGMNRWVNTNFVIEMLSWVRQPRLRVFKWLPKGQCQNWKLQAPRASWAPFQVIHLLPSAVNLQPWVRSWATALWAVIAYLLEQQRQYYLPLLFFLSLSFVVLI